ncbi:MAG: hypothetical protein NC223_02915 [Butyrivibrio sp.]|nr:hypothetical protein [Butyrivibrio sp.]
MKMSKSRIALVLLLAFALLLPTVKVTATPGNVFVFLHSEDFFPGNQKWVDSFRKCIKSYSTDTRLEARPTVVYGMQQHLKNCGSLYICCHGDDEGSVLLIDIVGTEFILFQISDVPKNMDCGLAYLGACRSAQNNTKTGKNLCSTLVSNGYKAVIGYSSDVNHYLAMEFEENFFYYLAGGSSVYTAIEETKAYLRKHGKQTNKAVYDDLFNAVARFGNLGITVE